MSDRGFIETLPGHDGQVTAVRFITKDSFASADDRGVLRYWKKHQSQACMPHVNLMLLFNDILFHFSGGRVRCKLTEKPYQPYVSIMSVLHRDPLTLPSRFGQYQQLVNQVRLLVDIRITCFNVGYQDEIQETQHIALSGIFPFAIAMSSLPQSKSSCFCVSTASKD